MAVDWKFLGLSDEPVLSIAPLSDPKEMKLFVDRERELEALEQPIASKRSWMS